MRYNNVIVVNYNPIPNGVMPFWIIKEKTLKRIVCILNIALLLAFVALFICGCMSNDTPDTSATPDTGITPELTSTPDPTPQVPPPLPVWTPKAYTDLGAVRLATRLDPHHIMLRGVALRLQLENGLTAAEYIERTLLAYAPHWLSDMGILEAVDADYIRVSYIDVYMLMKFVWNIDMYNTTYSSADSASGSPVINAGDFWYIDCTKSRLTTQVTRSLYQPLGASTDVYYFDYTNVSGESGMVEALISPDDTISCGFRLDSVLPLDPTAVPAPTDDTPLNVEYVSVGGDDLSYPDMDTFIERVLPIRLTANAFYSEDKNLAIAFTLSHYCRYWLTDSGISLGSKPYIQISHINVIEFLTSVYGTTLGADSFLQSDWTIRFSDGSTRPLIWCDDNYWYISPNCEYSIAHSINQRLDTGSYRYSFDPEKSGANLGYTESGIVSVSFTPSSAKTGIKLGEMTLTDRAMHIHSYFSLENIDIFDKPQSSLIIDALCVRLALEDAGITDAADEAAYMLGLYIHTINHHTQGTDRAFLRLSHRDMQEISYMVRGSGLSIPAGAIMLDGLAYFDGEYWYVAKNNGLNHGYHDVTLMHQGLVYRYSYSYTSPETGRIYNGLVDVDITFPLVGSADFYIRGIRRIAHDPA